MSSVCCVTHVYTGSSRIQASIFRFRAQLLEQFEGRGASIGRMCCERCVSVVVLRQLLAHLLLPLHRQLLLLESQLQVLAAHRHERQHAADELERERRDDHAEGVRVTVVVGGALVSRVAGGCEDGEEDDEQESWKRSQLIRNYM